MPTLQLIADGDSITKGSVVTPYTSSLSLNGLWNISNIGASGEDLATMLANAPSSVDALYVPGVLNVVVIWGGTNDLCNHANGSPNLTLANLQKYCLGRRVAGFKTIVVPMCSRIGIQAPGGVTNDFNKNWYNSLINANYANFADVLVQLPAFLINDGAYADTTYFQVDGIHPNQTTQTTIIAPLISSAVNAVRRSLNLPCHIAPTDSRVSGVPVDCRTTPNIPSDSRVSIPQNSRNIL